LAEQFFRHMGAPRPVIDRMLRRLRTPPLVLDQLPIHPSICRHFRLDFLGDDPCWRFTEEGTFSTEEFYLKYMRFEWNRDLDDGLVLWHRGDLENAIERLECAISTSPKAARAYFARSNILARWGRLDEAVVNAQRAIEFAPCTPEFRLHLVDLLLKIPASAQQREALLQEAEREAREAVRLDPGSWQALAVLSHVLEHRRCYTEAIASLNDAISLEPEEPDFYACLGRLNERLDNFEAAETAYRHAVTLSQGDAHYVRVLNHFMAHHAARFGVSARAF
jgi:tetratricopeptide (TPR) repeat protein